MIAVKAKIMQPKRVYLESSVISYLTARPASDMRRLVKQRITKEWWKQRDGYDLFISQTVVDEIGRGDAKVAVSHVTLPKPSYFIRSCTVPEAVVNATTFQFGSARNSLHARIAPTAYTKGLLPVKTSYKKFLERAVILKNHNFPEFVGTAKRLECWRCQ